MEPSLPHQAQELVLAMLKPPVWQPSHQALLAPLLLVLVHSAVVVVDNASPIYPDLLQIQQTTHKTHSKEKTKIKFPFLLLFKNSEYIGLSQLLNSPCRSISLSLSGFILKTEIEANLEALFISYVIFKHLF